MTLVCEDANSKLVEVNTVTDVDDEDRVDQYFKVEVQTRFLSRSLVSVLQLMFCRGYEVASWSRL